jgi:hypothetical protein
MKKIDNFMAVQVGASVHILHHLHRHHQKQQQAHFCQTLYEQYHFPVHIS